MARLRAPNGCPWDREQTHATLRTYLIEEAYEVLDALDGADDAKFAEELGDLLLQVLFHAQIAHEEGRFAIDDVIREIYEKMIRRHPHVFGDARAKTAADVLRNWEVIKKQEREAKQREVKDVKEAKEVKDKKRSRASSSFTSSTSSASLTSLLDGVPRSLPALLEAFQLTRKAARIGFDWYDIDGIFAKLDEEAAELRHALSSAKDLKEVKKVKEMKDAKDAKENLPLSSFTSSSSSTSLTSSVESELGDILFVAVNLARFLNVDPEIALKKTNAKFSRRFREMERLAREQGTTLAQVPRPQMESLWDQAKLHESRDAHSHS
jgi:MazG family protein